MDLRSEVNQLAARNKDVVIGLADGTVLRGRFAAPLNAHDDAVAFAASAAYGPGEPFIRSGVFIPLASLCWVETA